MRRNPGESPLPPRKKPGRPGEKRAENTVNKKNTELSAARDAVLRAAAFFRFLPEKVPEIFMGKTQFIHKFREIYLNWRKGNCFFVRNRKNEKVVVSFAVLM